MFYLTRFIFTIYLSLKVLWSFCWKFKFNNLFQQWRLNGQHCYLEKHEIAPQRKITGPKVENSNILKKSRSCENIGKRVIAHNSLPFEIENLSLYLWMVPSKDSQQQSSKFQSIVSLGISQIFSKPRQILCFHLKVIHLQRFVKINKGEIKKN